MSREEELKRLIHQKGLTVKAFARQIDMPYSTLLSILNGSVGGASLDNAIKICDGLAIGLDSLQNRAGHTPRRDAREQSLVESYRAHPGLQAAVNKLLDLEEEDAG